MDRNILRVAIYEMLHCPDVAPVVIINEAIEIAKKFGTEKSGRLRQRHPRPHQAGELSRPACTGEPATGSQALAPADTRLDVMAFGFFKSLIQKFTGRPVDWDELEEALIRADLGVPMTTRILKALQPREENLTAERRS